MGNRSTSWAGMQTDLSCEKSSELIAVALLLSLTLGSLNANLLVVLLKSCKVLSGFAELALLHAFSDIPMHKRTLTVHQVKLVIDARKYLCDSSRVADHAASAHDLGQVAARYHSGWLIVDPALEACGRPIYKLNCSLGLDRCNRSVHILRHHVTTVHHAASHVFSMTGIALYK